MPEQRLPHTRKRKGIIEYQRFIPKHLQALCGGKAWFIRSTGERTTRDAKPNWARFEVAYDDLIKAAQAAYEAGAKGFNGPVREIWIGRNGATISTVTYGPAGSYMPLPGLQTREIPLQGQTPVASTMSLCVPTATVLPLWAADRDQKPKPRSFRNKSSKMTALFEFLGKEDNLRLITDDDLQHYKEHLLKIGDNNLANDHLTDIVAMLNSAYANKKLTVNPALGFRIPPKRQVVTRPAFDDDQTRRLWKAAEIAEPIVKWGIRLGATLGLITSEFSEANCRDIEWTNTIPVFHIRTKFRRDGQELKTGFRPRSLPLHKYMVQEFLDYVHDSRDRYGEDAPLFAYLPEDRDGLRSVTASKRIMALIRTLEIQKPYCHYSFRHRVATILEGMSVEVCKPARQRYILGHARRDVHESYPEHPPHELKPIIDAIPVG
jgi:integrase